MVCQQEGAEPCNEGSSGNGDDDDDMLQADGARATASLRQRLAHQPLGAR